MKKQIYEIDEEGFISEIHVGYFDVDGILISHSSEFVTIDFPQEYYKPRWIDTKWIEGETTEEKAERESILNLESIKPTYEQIEDAKLEIKSIQILQELGAV